MIADDIWDMLLGKAGRLPGELAPEILEKAKAEGREFFDGDPQDNYPDALNKYRKMMNEKHWEVGEDDEDLFEYAMHPAQYEAYKSGKAKIDFLADIAKRQAEKSSVKKEVAAAPAAGFAMPSTPQILNVDVNGQPYRVTVSFDGASTDAKGTAASAAPPAASTSAALASAAHPITKETSVFNTGIELLSPLEGKFFLVKATGDTPVKVGDTVKKDQTVCYIEAMKTYNAVSAESDGVITAILLNPGDAVSEDDIIMIIASSHG
jgi:pyruvate carboxylase subunit B